MSWCLACLYHEVFGDRACRQHNKGGEKRMADLAAVAKSLQEIAAALLKPDGGLPVYKVGDLVKVRCLTHNPNTALIPGTVGVVRSTGAPLTYPVMVGAQSLNVEWAVRPAGGHNLGGLLTRVPYSGWTVLS